MEWYSYPAPLLRRTIPVCAVHPRLAIDKSEPPLIPEIQKYEAKDFLHPAVGE
jgi:hypothetical protein